MANLSPLGAANDACDKGTDIRFAVFSRVVAIALLTPIVGYLLEENNSRVREFIRDYSHSELLVFLAGCGVIACVEALAWLVRWSFSKGAFDGLIRRCD